MPDDPLLDNKLRTLAKAYFARLESRPAPAVMPEKFSRPSRGRSRALPIAGALASFIVIGGIISFATFNNRLASHITTGTRSSVSPSPPTGFPWASPSTSVSPSSPPTPAAAAACATSQLGISYLGPLGGAGTVIVEFELRDIGSAACELTGWPNLQLLNAAGAFLSTRVTQTSSIAVATAEPTPVVLLPALPPPPGFQVPPNASNQQASGYAYIWMSGDDALAPCETAAEVDFSLPDTTGTLAVSLQEQPSFPDGLQFCSGGSVDVLPIVASPPTGGQATGPSSTTK